MRMMIIEDEQRARRGLKGLLLATAEEQDEIVAEASNGKDGLELIKTLKPDVVFTDIEMPYINGLELIKNVRKEGLTTIFVIISAYAEFEYARSAISLGVTEYLVKPLIMEDVEQALESVKKRMKKTDMREKPKSLAERYPGIHHVILCALRKIEKNYGSSLSQKELAEELGISQEYFSSLFTKNIGESFVKFLRNYRIEIAKSLYSNGGALKEEVPYRVGFSDEKYFNRVFKDVTGMSVGEYIRQNRKNEQKS